MTSAVLAKTYRARSLCPPEEVVLRLREHLIALCALQHTASPDDPGLQILVAGGQHLRLYSVPAEGVLLAELSGGDRASDFEIFVVPHADGDIRAGWRRRFAVDSDPPAAWLALESLVKLDGQVHPRVDPDFAVLLASLVAGGPTTIGYEDSDARAGLAADVTHLRDTVERQAALIRRLQFAATARPADDMPVSVPAPALREWRLADLPEWADLHADSITILPRAMAEAKKADLENEQLAFDSLNLLAYTYRLVKLSELPREDFKTRADQLGLFIGGSISAPGEHGDAYFVQHGGRRRLLDQHLGRGTSRDSRFSLRVYFFWDEDTKRAVVGWLPSHLPNSMT